MKQQKNKESFGLSDTALMNQEEHLETGRKRRQITIGIPCETEKTEKRVSLTPEAVNILVENGNEVIIQEGAGLGANYSNRLYSENGATITKSSGNIFNCDLVIKVAPFTAKR